MRKSILIVEPDSELRDALVESLSPFRTELCTIAVAEKDAAARVLGERAIDLLVADLGCAPMDGFVTARQLIQMTSDVPVLALAGESAPNLSDGLEASLRVLRRPVDFERFREVVLDLLRKAPRGHLSGVSVVGFLQLLSAECRSGVLVVECPSGNGRLVVVEGELVDADWQGVRGEGAIYSIIQNFEDVGGEIWVEQLPDPVERTVNAQLGWLLLEAARRRDDETRPVAVPATPEDGCDL